MKLNIKKRMENLEFMTSKYDEFADKVICSEDFINCKERTSNDNCKEYYKKEDKLRRCWHIKICPLGKERK